MYEAKFPEVDDVVYVQVCSVFVEQQIFLPLPAFADALFTLLAFAG